MRRLLLPSVRILASAKKSFVCTLTFLFCASASLVLAQTVSLTTIGGTFTQNFDGMANAGTSSTMPNGWYFNETLTNADATYLADNGTSVIGNTHSYGFGVSTDRTFGTLLDANLNATIGGAFTNNTGTTINTLAIGYKGEEWRCGTTGRGPDRLDFQYSLDATSLTTGTWIDVNALDFNTPNLTAVGAFNGNAPGNFVLLGNNIVG